MIESVKLSKRRYCILLLYFILVFHIYSQWTQFQVISGVSEEFFGVSTINLDWTVTIWYPVYIVGCFFITAALSKLGLRFCIIMASLVNFLGTLVKYLAVIYRSYGLVLFGQVLAACGQVFTFSLPANIASTWFPTDIASTITATAIFPFSIGGGFGYLLPPLFVPNDTSSDDIETNLKRFMLIYAISALVILLLNLVFFANKPKNPPSIASAKATINPTSFLKAWKKILTNRNSNFILGCYASMQAITNILLALLSPLMETAFPKENQFIGLVGLVVLIISIPGSFLFAWITDRTKKYQRITYIMGCSVFPFFGLFILGLRLRNKVLAVLAPIFIGFISGGSYPIGVDYIVQSNYPLSDSISSTLMMFCNQVISWPLTDAVSYLLHNYGVLLAMVPIWIMLAVAMLSASFIKQDLNRDEADKESSSFKEESLGGSYSTIVKI